MAAAFKRFAGKTLSGSLWHAAPMIAQVAAGLAACGLWVGVASPNLQLLPGVNARSDASVEIALQSALLGIDDGSSRSESAVLAASYAHLPSPSQLRRSTATPRARVSLVVSLSHGIAADRAPARRGMLVPDTPTAGLVAVPASALADAPVRPATQGSPSVGPVVAAPAGGGQAGGASEQPRPEQPRPEQPKPTTPVVPKVAAPRAAESLDQQIAIATTLPATAYVGATFTVSASASSGLPVTLSVSGSPSVCRLTGSSLTLRATGVCTLEARQPGNARYKERRVERSIDVVRASQSISFVDPAPVDAVAGERTYRVEARASSGLAVSLSSLTPDVCTLSGTNVRTVGAGGCTIEASQAGTDAYEPAASVRLGFEVHEPVHRPAAQTVAFGSTVPSGALVGGAAYPVSAVASSGLSVDLSVDPASVGVCTKTGNLVTFIGEGTCTIRADQAGGHGFLAAPTVSQSLLVARAPQAVSFLSTPPASAVAGLTTYVVVASSSVSLPVTLSVAQSSAAVCAISGAVVTAIAAGTCEIEADQPGDTAHLPASQAVQSFFGRQRDAVAERPDDQLHVDPAVIGRGRRPRLRTRRDCDVRSAGGLSAAASSAGICTVNGSTVTLVGAGTCTIAADQSGSTGIRRAAQVQQSFAVGLAAQAIGFTSVPPAPAAAGGAGYTVAAVATSGLPVTFSLDPVSAGICSVTGAAVSMAGRGTCTVFADQAGVRRMRPPAGSPELHDRRRPGEHEPADDQLHDGGPDGCSDRRQLYACRVRQLRPAGHLCGRGGERGRLRPLGRRGFLRRDGHVHGARRPGGQCELRPGASGPPVVRRLTATARTADDQLHVGGPVCGRGRRCVICRRGDRELGSARRLLGSPSSNAASAHLPAPRSRSSAAARARSPRIRRATAVTPPRRRRSSRSPSPASPRRSRSRRRRLLWTSTARRTRSLRPPPPASRSFQRRRRELGHLFRLGRVGHVPEERGLHRERQPGRRHALPAGGAGAADDRGASRMRDLTAWSAPRRGTGLRRERSMPVRMMLSRPRTLRLAGSPVVRYATLVFLLAAGLIGTVTFSRPKRAQQHVARAFGRPRGWCPGRRIILRVAAHEPAHRGHADGHVAVAPARDRAARRPGAAPDRRRSPCPHRPRHPVDRIASRRTADRLDCQHHRRSSPPCHRLARDPARRQGRDVAAASDPLPRHGGFLLTHDGVVLAGGPVGEPVASGRASCHCVARSSLPRLPR